ncbi:MAG: hypothetical protein OHK0022_45490 [Roseiflexaceae bacterium]
MSEDQQSQVLSMSFTLSFSERLEKVIVFKQCLVDVGGRVALALQTSFLVGCMHLVGADCRWKPVSAGLVDGIGGVLYN